MQTNIIDPNFKHWEGARKYLYLSIKDVRIVENYYKTVVDFLRRTTNLQNCDELIDRLYDKYLNNQPNIIYIPTPFRFEPLMARNLEYFGLAITVKRFPLTFTEQLSVAEKWRPIPEAQPCTEDQSSQEETT